MAKLLLILVFGGALANGLASSHSQPPLLIESHPAPAPIIPLDDAR
jgi:hypothetical protein